MEIITREQGTGIYILNYALDSLIFISEPNLYGNAFATGDFNQDGKMTLCVLSKSMAGTI